MFWSGVQVLGTIHNIVALAMFFVMRMLFRLLRKRLEIYPSSFFVLSNWLVCSVVKYIVAEFKQIVRDTLFITKCCRIVAIAAL